MVLFAGYLEKLTAFNKKKYFSIKIQRYLPLAKFFPMKKTLFLFTLILVIFSCQSEPASSDTEKIDQPEVTPTAQEEEAPSNGERYLHLEGTIGDYPITMNLSIAPVTTAEGWSYTGNYYYNKVGKPLALSGYSTDNEPIELEESDHTGNATGKFIGNIDAQNVFSGSWRSADNSKSLDFTLNPGGGMSFKLLTFSDSLEWKTEGTEGSTAYYEQTWLWPSGNLAADRRNFLSEKILQEMAGDSLAQVYHDPQMIFKAQKDQFFKDFTTEMQLILDNYDGESPEWLPPGYGSSTSMEVIYNGDKLLTLAYLNYSYEGGAHGNYGTMLKVYDLEEKRILNLNDLFKPDYEAIVNQALDQSLRKAYNIPDNKGLSEVLFDDTIAVNDNFGLTPKGIIFNYVPYEISAYAVGEIRLYIPFEDLKEVLKEEILK